MSNTTRRTFLALSSAAGALLSGGVEASNSAVSAKEEGAGMSLVEALSRRRSTRMFADTAVQEEALSMLLWCAVGVNRPESGGRTAPSWRTSYGTDIYVADATGIRKFDPLKQTSTRVAGEDIRAKASPQPFVATAPTVLVYVADLSRMYEAPQEEQVQAAHVDAGIIAQNVYLYCASAGLGTCLVGGVDKAGLAKLMNLPETQIVTFVQPVGYPKQAA